MQLTSGIFPNLNAEIARHSLSSLDLANIINTNTSSLWRKMTGKTDFKLKEMLALQEAINSLNGNYVSLDYLFSVKGGE